MPFAKQSASACCAEASFCAAARPYSSNARSSSFNSGDGLYTEDAPYGSIAHSDDYDRTSALAARGVIVTPSTLEMLALGSCRVVTVKVIAYSGDAIARERRGHLEALFALHGIQKHIVANARVSHDETLERVCDGTDVAGVRAHAASAEQARAADPEEVAAAARAEADDAPEMRTFGALAAPAQSMGQVLAAIATAVSPDNPAMAAAQAANASQHVPAGAPAGAMPCTQQRGETPRDDYGGAASALYDTFWPLFPLRRGITPGRAVDARQTQHMLLYFDNRFSQTLPLVFTLADMRLRHAVNLTVSARVRTDPGAFDTFVALVNDQQFATNLKAARRKPDGPVARAVVAQAMQFIDLAGSCEFASAPAPRPF
ncbi:hypothetical protein KFE25_011404 [Diacronema lutheri]|uniref:Uncharacterized protein n=1 Tax=Diacronema lutheri TaxID=2081491 RepID=A0A8J6C4Z0_DIALT|nr:hypothetical protein KFE25_011404 [Diacronema lutheri]